MSKTNPRPVLDCVERISLAKLSKTEALKAIKKKVKRYCVLYTLYSINERNCYRTEPDLTEIDRKVHDRLRALEE